jgi:lipoprotein NlpD
MSNTKFHIGFIASCGLSIAALSGCTTTDSGPAPVVDIGRHGAGTDYSSSSSARVRMSSGQPYTVKRGDTLYGIAWMYGADVKSLAAENGLHEPYMIRVGQVLHYGGRSTGTEAEAVDTGSAVETGSANSSGGMVQQGAVQVASQPLVSSDDSFHEERAVDQKSDKTPSKPVVGKNETDYSGSTDKNGVGLSWQWPTNGRQIEGFSAGDQGNKGIDIAGKRGQPVVAAADGRVVYAGNALRGYGNLIIIKHNDDYLSAYAHNDSLLVKEQQSVKAGQKIADMGSSESSDVRLHFEIRYHGQSVDPMRFLPKR